MTNQEELRIKLEESGIPTDKIDEVISFFDGKATIEPSLKGNNIFFELWKEMERAQTWQDKSRIQAKIMSEKIGDY